jgi:hypothetical protein
MQSESIAAGPSAAKFLGLPLTIEPMTVACLRPYGGNARTQSKKQVRQIADSIRKFGFTNPVLVSDDNEIIAGHGRVEAAKLLPGDSFVRDRFRPHGDDRDHPAGRRNPDLAERLLWKSRRQRPHLLHLPPTADRLERERGERAGPLQRRPGQRSDLSSGRRRDVPERRYLNRPGKASGLQAVARKGTDPNRALPSYPRARAKVGPTDRNLPRVQPIGGVGASGQLRTGRPSALAQHHFYDVDKVLALRA